MLDAFGPYFTDRYRTPWGAAVNVDGAGVGRGAAVLHRQCPQVVRDFHIDGLRLDAMHGIVDTTARPFLADLSAAVDELASRSGGSWSSSPRAPTTTRGWSGTGTPAAWASHAQWNDDFHHAAPRRPHR